MKIGLVVPEYPPDTIGGGGVVFDALARGLAKNGHDVRVLTSATAGGPSGDDASLPFRLMRVRQLPHPTEQYKTYMPPSPVSLASARGFLRDCDVVHLHGYGMAFVDAVAACFVDLDRAVFTSHGLPYTARRSRGPLGWAYRAYDRVFGRRVLRAHVLTAVSAHAADELGARSGRTVRVVPNGLAPVAPADRLPDEVAREVAKGPYLLGVGRLVALKGFEDAIRALGHLAGDGIDLRLLIAGEEGGAGPGLLGLARACGVEDRVSLVGRVSRPDLACLYAGAVATVVTSRVESFSLAGLEAMAAGSPAVLYPVGGIVDYARDRENALLVGSCEPAGLAVAVAELVRTPGLRETVVAGGTATVPRFAWDAVVGRYEAIYRECLERGENR